MRGVATGALIAGCLATLLASFYGSALFRGEQFAFRDTAHYYYPLHRVVQSEWEAGRWPLWEPGENAGMPLLGNPTAAVLYPGKLLYAVLPYAWAARLYVIGHTVIAFATMLALLRSWGATAAASALAAMAYAFGAPIVFLHCNVIYLVGAAWTPLGFRAADLWLRGGRRRGLIELGVVLSLQILGGDPESADLQGVCAVGYALGLAWRGGGRGAESLGGWGWRCRIAAGAGAAMIVWVGATLALACRVRDLRPPPGMGPLPMVLPGMRWLPAAVSAVWLLTGTAVFLRWWKQGRTTALVPRLAGLAGSAALAAALSAAQLLPVLEFIGQTTRAVGDGRHDIYPFSVEPVRMLELAWPGLCGLEFSGNRCWLGLIRPPGVQPRIWIPSLYLGGLTLVLSLVGLGFRGGTPARGWLTVVAAVSLLGSFGEFTGPLWWARCFPAWQTQVGPHDMPNSTAIRLDGQLRDGDGGVYWALATALPGFGQFRYPGKLTHFSALALAALAGLGWDRLGAGPGRRRGAFIAASLLALGLLALAITSFDRSQVLAVLGANPGARVRSPSGPYDAEGSYAGIRRALVHGSVVMALGLALIVRGARRPRRAAALALLVMAADLSLANAAFVVTAPQALFDTKPRAVVEIEAAERRADPQGQGDGAAGPFRVHRLPYWYPSVWEQSHSPERLREILVWEHDTILPKYGLTYGLEYTVAYGVGEIDDFQWYFGIMHRPVENAALARMINVRPGQWVVGYARRAFDLWNTRYFVVPMSPNGWNDETRGFASFLAYAERVYPPVDRFQGPGGLDRQRRWAEREDIQIFRNRAAYPRAWVVHGARFVPTVSGTGRAQRDAITQEIVYAADPVWTEPGRPVHDPRHVAWLEAGTRAELAGYLPGAEPLPSESPRIRRYEAQRVEIEVTLKRPGLVVLADTFYPGWRLTIDGAPAPIYRTNRLMRGAAVPAGRHRLLFRYEPASFRAGLTISGMGLLVLLTLGLASLRRRVAPGQWPARSRVDRSFE